MPHGITQCYLPPGRGDIPGKGGERESPIVKVSRVNTGLGVLIRYDTVT